MHNIGSPNQSISLNMSSFISGTGSALAERTIPNAFFLNNTFYDKNGVKNEKDNQDIIAKLEAITGIRERRYIPDNQSSVPLMAEAAKNALLSAHIDVNALDGIIVAHNSGNMLPNESAFHPIPNIAALLKNALEMSNHQCFAYDLLFGCPGWLQGLIQAHQTIKCGDADNILVVGLEIASRMMDPHDLDSMIFADGCGACVLSRSNKPDEGIVSYATFSHAEKDLMNIHLGKSNNPSVEGNTFCKMTGKDVYRYATTWVPQVIKKALDKKNLSIQDIDSFLLHQANEKMLSAIASSLGALYGINLSWFENKIPMTIDFLGNTSVATIPTMLDLILKNQLKGYSIQKGQRVVMASVGAGMHCNAIVYQF